jgi:ketosteroid isomerase-like protein
MAMTNDDLAAAVQQLADIEAIKQLKARYFRLIDTKDWTAFADVFTDDCKHYYVDQDGTENFTTNDDYLPKMKATLANGVTTHHGHTPEITFLSATEAEGIWAMFDYVQCDTPNGRVCLMGYGHYFETYRKCDDGRWRMSAKRNVRLRVDEVPWTLPET